MKRRKERDREGFRVYFEIGVHRLCDVIRRLSIHTGILRDTYILQTRSVNAGGSCSDDGYLNQHKPTLGLLEDAKKLHEASAICMCLLVVFSCLS